MEQFYERYKDNEKVSPLVTQLSLASHFKIISELRIAATYQQKANRG
jgi:hypothetical protein